MRKIFLLLLASVTITSCGSDELDRDLAGELISDYYQYPNLEYINLGSHQYCLGLSEWHNKLLDKRVIERTRRYFSSDDNCWHEIYEPTEKNKKFLISKFNTSRKNTVDMNRYIVSVRNFNEVTGIKFNDTKTEATVNFTVKRSKVTPFGTAIGWDKEINDYQTKFELYDDGWRLVDKNSFENYKYEKDLYGFLDNMNDNTTSTSTNDRNNSSNFFGRWKAVTFMNDGKSKRPFTAVMQATYILSIKPGPNVECEVISNGKTTNECVLWMKNMTKVYFDNQILKVQTPEDLNELTLLSDTELKLKKIDDSDYIILEKI